MRGAIFDVDGTLLDSMQVWWDVVVDFFKEHGVELPYEEAKEYKEMTMKESIPTIKNRLNLDFAKRLLPGSEFGITLTLVHSRPRSE